ncbi:MAG: serine/threonine protein kinase [Myxococcales bacterium]|nr:serine/threonine protein kinase [Myxococcales bacterium]
MSHPPVAGLIAGRYFIDGPLGTGGMATVHRATDQVTGEAIALKLLSPQSGVSNARRRFELEGRLLAGFDHPHIVGFRDMGALGDDSAYLAMDLVEGGSLHDRLDAEGELPLGDAVTFGCQILEALTVLHAQGVVHRDLKPDNILLAGGMHVVVIDFGLARVPDHRLTVAGRFLGSPAFASTEQLNGRPVGPRSDLFALGALLYSMLTGRAPFPGETAQELRRQHAGAPPLAPSCYRSSVPADLDGLVMDLLNPWPGLRPEDAATVLQRLQGIRVAARRPRDTDSLAA